MIIRHSVWKSNSFVENKEHDSFTDFVTYLEQCSDSINDNFLSIVPTTFKYGLHPDKNKHDQGEQYFRLNATSDPTSILMLEYRSYSTEYVLNANSINLVYPKLEHVVYSLDGGFVYVIPTDTNLDAHEYSLLANEVPKKKFNGFMDKRAVMQSFNLPYRLFANRPIGTVDYFSGVPLPARTAVNAMKIQLLSYSQDEPDYGKLTPHQAALFCKDHPHNIPKHEQKFGEDIIKRGFRGWSDKQDNWLRSIYAKAFRKVDYTVRDAFT